MNTDPASPYLFSLIASKEGTEEAYREYQLALRYFNSQLVILKGVLGLTADLVHILPVIHGLRWHIIVKCIPVSFQKLWDIHLSQ